MTRIGLVTSGGDAPGMNAAIRAVVRMAYINDIEVIGYEKGYKGLIAGLSRVLGPRSVSGIINRGGTILKTARAPEFKTKEGLDAAARILERDRIDYLITIGGDGSFRGAWELGKVSGVPVIGVPATIDNDVGGTDTTIGFDTAVNSALEAIDKIRDTATSHERIFLVEVMGRRRGFIAVEVGAASGAEFILIPEVEFNMVTLCNKIEEYRRMGKASIIIVMAEGVGDVRRIASEIERKAGGEVRISRLGYIQRGGAPTAFSRKLAMLFGSEAVKLVTSGRGNRMVGIKDGKIVTPDIRVGFEEWKEIDIELYRLAEKLAV